MMIRKTRILILILVVLASTSAGIAWRLRGLISPEAKDIRNTVQFDEKTGNVNILAVGMDDVEGVHRSDTIAFITVDIDNKRIKVVSLPRDTRTSIRGHGIQKINHAFAYGGMDLLKETVVNLLGMPVHYSVAVNYQSFPKIVDILGGIDIDVEKNLRYNDKAGHLSINIKKGWRHMDGKTALGYVRFRHDALGDIGRIRRQQRFLKALLKKMYDPVTLSNISEITSEFLSILNTDIPPSKALLLASYLKDIPPGRVSFFTMPGKAALINGVSYWSPDLVQMSTMLTSDEEEANVLVAEGPQNSNASDDLQTMIRAIDRPVAVLNGDGASGLGKKVSSQLERRGIEVSYVGNARHFDFHYSTISHKPGEENHSAALALADLCDIPENLVQTDTKSAYEVTVTLGHDKDRILGILEQVQ